MQDGPTQRTAAALAPGSNLLGDASSSNWRFILPSLEYRSVLYLGTPSRNELSELANRFDSVTVSARNGSVNQIRDVVEAIEGQNISVLDGATDPMSPPKLNGVDLIRYNDGQAFRRLLRDRGAVRSLQQSLTPEGAIFGEILGVPSRSFRSVGSMSAAEPSIVPLWLSPVSGNADHFAPLHDRHIADRLLRHGGYQSTFAARMSQRAHWSILNHPRVRQRLGRYGAIIGGLGGAVATSAPPLYIRRLAHEWGLSLDDYHWGAWAGGRFLSKKVLIFLHREPDDPPEYVVKITRTPELNYRLENAYRALTALHERDVFTSGSLPAVAFFGHHGGSALLAESIVEGVSFEDSVRAQPHGNHLERVAEQLRQIALTTRSASQSSIGAAVDEVRCLFERFASVYRLDSSELAFLAAQVDELSNSRDALMTVFEHGDCGTWNIMTRSDGNIVFLDWEAANPTGLPLWDLFYFMQTYVNLVDAHRDVVDPVTAFKRQLLQNTEVSGRASRAIVDYCTALGLNTSLVAPLFYTCWMHRAVKESTRLDEASLDSGQYIRLLKLSIARDSRRGLAHLFGTDSLSEYQA